MGNAKDGKLGFELEGSKLVDIELPTPIQGVKWFTMQLAKSRERKFPLFEDYDILGDSMNY